MFLLEAHSPDYVGTELPGVFFVLLLGCFTVVTLLMDPYCVQHMCICCTLKYSWRV